MTDFPLHRDVAAPQRERLSWVRLAIACAIASAVATVLITVGTIFLYEGRGFVFGDEDWSPLAWSYARLDTYLYGICVNSLFVGLPVALCTFLIAVRLRSAGRRIRVVAVVAPSLATLIPAWWAAAWDGPPLLALLVGSLSALFGAGVFLLAAHIAGYTRTAAGMAVVVAGSLLARPSRSSGTRT